MKFCRSQKTKWVLIILLGSCESTQRIRRDREASSLLLSNEIHLSIFSFDKIFLPTFSSCVYFNSLDCEALLLKSSFFIVTLKVDFHSTVFRDRTGTERKINHVSMRSSLSCSLVMEKALSCLAVSVRGKS